MLQHIGLESRDKGTADRFFVEVLGLEEKKTATLSPELNLAIFGMDGPVEMVVYENEKMSVEVFLSGSAVTPSYGHACLVVPKRETLMEKCRKHDLPVITVQKGDKELLFIRDFSGNLYERYDDSRIEADLRGAIGSIYYY